MPITRAKLDRLRELEVVEVAVPGWKEVCCVRELNALERLQLQSTWNSSDNTSLLTLLAMTMCDGNGDRLYTDDEKDLIGRHKLERLEPLIDASLKLSGLSEEAEETVKKN
jgi:hypothetical protein